MFLILVFFVVIFILFILFFKNGISPEIDYGCKSNKRVKKLTEKVTPSGLLTPFEKKMYWLLVESLPNKSFQIQTQVSFNAFIACKEVSIRNKFNRMSCDFLIVDQDFDPIVCIELDDRTHLMTKEKDAFRDDLLSAAFIPTERFIGLPSNVNEVKKRLKPYYSSKRSKTQLYRFLKKKKIN